MSNFVKNFNYNRDQILKDSDVVSFRVVNNSDVGGDDDYRGFFKSNGTSNGSTSWIDNSNGHSITKLPNQGGYAWLYMDNDSVPQFVSEQIENSNENTKEYPWNISKKWVRFDGGSTALGFNTLTFSDFSVTESLAEFTPVLGAEMNFTASNFAWNASNYNSFITPMGVNSLMLNARLSFIEDLDRTKTLLNYLQSKTTGVITGDEAFTGNLNYVNFSERDTIYYNNFEDIELGPLGTAPTAFAELKEKLSNDQLIVTEVHGGDESIISVFDQIGPIHGAGSSTRISSNNISFKALELRDSFARYGLQFSGFPEQATYTVSGKYVLEPRHNSNIHLEFRSTINGAVSNSSIESSGRFGRTIAQSNPGPTRDEQRQFKFNATIGTQGVLEINMLDDRDTPANSALQIDEIAIMRNEGAVIHLDNSGIYQNFSGSQVSDFTVTDIGNDIYKIDVSLFNNTVSSMLNNGQGFIKPVQYQSISETNFAHQDFSRMFKQGSLNNNAIDPQTGYEVYKKFDVVEKTGTNDFKWVCLSGVQFAEVAMPFPDTEIYEETWPDIRNTFNSLPEGADRTKVVSANSKPTTASLTLTSGKFYRATKYVNITKNDQQHAIAPFSLAGQAFSFTVTRNTPHRIFMCNISNSELKIKRTRSDLNATTAHGGVNHDTSKEEMTFQPGQIREMDVDNLGVHYLTGVSGASNTFDRNFIVTTVGLSTPTSNADVDKMLIAPVVTSHKKLNTYTYRRRDDPHDEIPGSAERDLLHQVIQSSHVKNNALYAQSGVAATEIGDGSGGDSCMSLGINNLYNYAAYGRKLKDYAIVTPYSGHIDVSYYSGDSWHVYTGHDLNGGDGTLTEGNPFPQGLNPDFVFNTSVPGGGMAGDTSSFFNDSNLWKFESTCPVGIWINDHAADEEILVGTDSIIGNENPQRRPHGLHNYFYVSGDTKCLGPELQGEAGFTGGIGATRSFFWEPDRSVPININNSQRVRKFKYSFDKVLNVSRNQNRITNLELTFSNRTDKEAYSLLHFLESHLGYKHFVYKHNLNAINNNKVFYCPKWNHVFNYKDSNTIKATFVEIVSPVVPEL